ncbi:MAG: diaminopimelate decarboxylase, partial [Betaproteobacteria bacterium]
MPAAAFARRDGELHCENVPLSLIAERFGTPTYVYSKASILAAYAGYAEALAGQPALVC